MKKFRKEKSKDMKKTNTNFTIQTLSLNKIKTTKGITLIALVITILFSYDEKIKYSNSKGFLQTI